MNPITIVSFILLLTGMGMVASAEETLSSLQLKYGVAVERLEEPQRALRSNYTKRLDDLRKVVTAEGDLATVLAIKDELLALENDTLGTVAENASLKRLQEIYRSESESLVKSATNERIRITSAYIDHLGQLKEGLTRQNRIEEALKASTEADAKRGDLARWTENQKSETTPELAPESDDQSRWKAFQDGKYSQEEETVHRLRGPGADRDTSVAAVALLMRELGPVVRIKGKCRITGDWGGFILGSDKRLSDYLMLYATPGEASFNHETVTAGVRANATLGAYVSIPRDKWLDFAVERKDNVWTFEIEGTEKELPTVSGEGRDYFGLMVFSGSEIRIKDLSIRERN